MESIATRPTGMKWGLIMGAGLIVFGLIQHFTNTLFNETLSYLSYLITGGAIFLALREYKQLNGDSMTLGEGVKVGMWASLVGGVVGSLYSLVFMTFIRPTFLEETLAFAREKLEENPQMTEEVIDQTMSMTANFTTPTMITIFGIVGALIGGLVISLILSAIMKAERPIDMDEIGS